MYALWKILSVLFWTLGLPEHGVVPGTHSARHLAHDAGVVIPPPTGRCPPFRDGYVEFSPPGQDARAVRMYVGPRAYRGGGPLVFFWHGLGGAGGEAYPALGADLIASVRYHGGVVVAPESDPASGAYPWFLTTGEGPDHDLVLADEIVSCAVDQWGVDPRRIHVAGFSAGGFQAVQMAYRRAEYVASVVPVSGGLLKSPPVGVDVAQLASLVVHGGTQDHEVVSFAEASETYARDQSERGHFAAICNHGGGHQYPAEVRRLMRHFFFHHQYGEPSPYGSKLPDGSPSFCGMPSPRDGGEPSGWAQ